MPQHCVLIVESELPVRHPVAEYLRECGYQVLEAVNTSEAMTLLRAKGNIDVVLVDASNPGVIDVFALSKWVRETKHRAKVLAAGSIPKMAEGAGELCSEGPTLTRPYHHVQLQEEIRRLLAAHERSNDAE